MNRPSVLVLSARLALDSGDSVVGRVSALSGGEEKALFEAELPVADARAGGVCLDARIDLSEYTGRSVRLKIQTYNRPGRHTVGDWAAWVSRAGSSGATDRHALIFLEIISN